MPYILDQFNQQQFQQKHVHFHQRRMSCIYKQCRSNSAAQRWDKWVWYKYLIRLKRVFSWFRFSCNSAHEASLLISFAAGVSRGSPVPTKPKAPANIWAVFFLRHLQTRRLPPPPPPPSARCAVTWYIGSSRPCFGSDPRPIFTDGFYVGHFSKAPSP